MYFHFFVAVQWLGFTHVLRKIASTNASSATPFIANSILLNASANFDVVTTLQSHPKVALCHIAIWVIA